MYYTLYNILQQYKTVLSPFPLELVVATPLPFRGWWWLSPFPLKGGGGHRPSLCKVVVVVATSHPLVRWWWWWLSPPPLEGGGGYLHYHTTFYFRNCFFI